MPPAPSSAASPPLEPPDVRAGSNALSVRPCGTDSVSYDHMYSGTVVFASTMAPARLTRATTVASASGTFPSRAAEPVRHGSPATASESLMRDREAEQRPVVARGAPAIGLGRVAQHLLVVDRGDGVEARVGLVQQLELVLWRARRAESSPARSRASHSPALGSRRAHRRRT